MLRVTDHYLSDFKQLRAMRARVRDVCRRAWALCPDEASANLIELAVNEAAANIIKHAYQGKTDQPIEMSVEADADEVRVALIYEGTSFQRRKVKPPAFDGSRQGGFGVYMIEQSTDEVRYWQDELGRNVIHLVKRRTNFSTKGRPDASAC